MFKAIGLVLLLLVGVLFVYSFSSSASKTLTLDQARLFVQNDLNSSSIESYRFNSEKSDSGEWVFEVLVSKNAHGVCPDLYKRTYRLLPMSFREEPVITSCTPRQPPLVYPEEAVLNTASDSRVQVLSKPYNCVFDSFNIDYASAALSCKYFLQSDFNALKAPAGSFAVLWVNELNPDQKLWFVVNKATGVIR